MAILRSLKQEDQFQHSILLSYYSYLFRLSVNFQQQNQSSNPHFYYTQTNLVNQGITLVPHLKQYINNEKLFLLIKQMSILLYVEIEKIYKQIVKKVVCQLKEGQLKGDKVIELHECYNETNQLSHKIVTFYSFIVQFDETRKLLPPVSINISSATIQELKKQAAAE